MPNFQLNSDVGEKLINLFTNRNGLDTMSLVFISALSLSMGHTILFGALLCCFFTIFCFCDLREITNLGNIGLEKEIQYYF